VFGLIGLALITVAAVPLNLQPGAISLLYLIVVVFVSLRAGFVSSVGVSLIAVFLPELLFSSAVLVTWDEEPAGHRSNNDVLNHRLGDYRNGGPGAEVDGSSAHPAI